jgi:hypothetical protein
LSSWIPFAYRNEERGGEALCRGAINNAWKYTINNRDNYRKYTINNWNNDRDYTRINNTTYS